MTGFTRLSRVLATSEPDSLWFECPGCKMAHRVMHGEGEGPRWGYNGNAESPTFTPSVLVRYNWGPEQKAVICHSFVTDGRVQFLTDCTHELAGQTVDLIEWED